MPPSPTVADEPIATILIARPPATQMPHAMLKRRGFRRYHRYRVVVQNTSAQLSLAVTTSKLAKWRAVSRKHRETRRPALVPQNKAGRTPLTWIFCQVMQQDRASDSAALLRAAFNIKLNGKPVIIATVGQAYRFITSLSPVEWMEHRSLRAEAKTALEAAAENGMLNIQATQALRTLFARAGLL
jgi:hypothetical protein